MTQQNGIEFETGWSSNLEDKTIVSKNTELNSEIFKQIKNNSFSDKQLTDNPDFRPAEISSFGNENNNLSFDQGKILSKNSPNIESMEQAVLRKVKFTPQRKRKNITIGMVKWTTYVDPNLLNRFKVECFERGLYETDLVNLILKQFFEKN